MTTPETPALVERLTRPIVGMAFRSAEEVFDIMADRIRSGLATQPDDSARKEPAADVVEALNDLKTHRRAWREALALARDYASSDSEEPEADAAYWSHELRAFDRTFAALTAAGLDDLRRENEALRSALERLAHNFGLLLKGRPVRDVAETEAEVRAALGQQEAG